MRQPLLLNICNTTITIFSRGTLVVQHVSINYTLDNRCRVFGFRCPFTLTFNPVAKEHGHINIGHIIGWMIFLHRINIVPGSYMREFNFSPIISVDWFQVQKFSFSWSNFSDLIN